VIAKEPKKFQDPPEQGDRHHETVDHHGLSGISSQSKLGWSHVVHHLDDLGRCLALYGWTLKLHDRK
jgi:hypothetical protein